MSGDTSEAEQCRVALSVALDKAAGACGEAEAKRQLARMLGLDTDSSGEPDINCAASLAEGLNRETMESFRGRNQWVFCRAWKYVDEENMDLRSALDKAWAKLKAEEQNRKEKKANSSPIDDLLEG